MRNISVVLLFTLALPSDAQIRETQPPQTDFVQICDRVEWIAETIMTGRQGGVGLAEMPRIFLDKGALEGLDSKLVEFLTQLVDELLIEAFGTPRISSAQYQENAVREFADRQFLVCLKAVRGIN